MPEFQYHVQMHKSEEDAATGRKKLSKFYPITYAQDVITADLLRQQYINSDTLDQILSSLGNLAFKDNEADGTTTGKGIVQLSNLIDSDSETTAATSKAVSTLNNKVEDYKVTIEEGAQDGGFLVNGQFIKIHGLGSAASNNTEDFATAEQGTKADNAMPIDGGTFNGSVYLNADPIRSDEAVTKRYVDSLIEAVNQEAADGIHYKGTVDVANNITLPYTNVKTGWEYKVLSEGIYAEYSCKPGDLLIAKITGFCPATSDGWDHIPSGNENETYLAYSKTDVTITEEYQSGNITVGEAATKQVQDDITRLDINVADLPTVRAVVNYISSLNLLPRSDRTKVKGKNETTYREGYVNLTPADIGAATEEQGERADSAIQKIVIGSVQTSEPGTEASIRATNDPITKITTLDFIVPAGDQGESIVGPVGPLGPTGADGAVGPTGPAGENGIDGAEGPVGPTGETGAVGPTGPKGPTGARGPTGETGATGAEGAPGPTGAMGPTGADGVRGNEFHFGTVITGTSSTPTGFENSEVDDAVIGDFYVNTNTYNVYKCNEGGDQFHATWIYIGCIKGDTGKSSIAITATSTDIDSLEEGQTFFDLEEDETI